MLPQARSRLPPQAREQLALAARLYLGDFAEGIDPDDDEIARRIEAERVRLRALAQDVLGRLGACETNPQTNEVAIGLARRLLALDPAHVPARTETQRGMLD